MPTVVKYGDLGTYVIDFDTEVKYGDRFILAHKKTKRLMLGVSPFPSEKDSYKRVKVIWYYEKPGTDNTSLYKDLESELIGMLSEEITREINREIMNTIRLQNP